LERKFLPRPDLFLPVEDPDELEAALALSEEEEAEPDPAMTLGLLVHKTSVIFPPCYQASSTNQLNTC